PVIRPFLRLPCSWEAAMPEGRIESIHTTPRGVALNHLVGREFTVGPARFLGHELCEPCKHLAGLTGRPEILPGLIHRGGLRAEILQGGLIRPGDELRS
ncbi:MAG: MOSC domain-containing protein, partial [Geothrix sp.]|nr:MOSC domain-containing protein [Geothrix sp.]